MQRLPQNDPKREADLGRACDRCGAHVSRAYYRAFEIDGQLHACPQCGNARGVSRGGATDPDRRT